jgi:hypothetical protein
MVNGERLEIRPKVARNAALLAAGCLVFVVLGDPGSVNHRRPAPGLRGE